MMIRALILCALLLTASRPVDASFDDQTRCYKQLQLDFFRDDFTRQAFSLYDVPESQWEIILVDLRERVKTVPNRLKRRTMHMQPDPLNYPFRAKNAGEILYQVLFEVFIETLHANSINSEADIHDMFNYIFDRQLGRWEACLGKGSHSRVGIE